MRMRFRGEPSGIPTTSLDLGPFARQFTVEADQEFQLADVRGGPVVDLEVEDEDTVEISLEGGVQLWLAGGTLRDLYEATGQRQARDGTLTLPPYLPLGTPSRGIGRWAIRAMKKLVLKDAQMKVASLAAARIAEGLEDQLLETEGGGGGPGLYRCGSPRALGERVDGGLEDDGLTLLFLHGTASRYDGSFGEMADDVWEQMTRRYEGRIYALQHRTLSESPIHNALELAEKLPEGARLHVVSHSRGGLVGELLARAGRQGDPFDDLELAHFERAAGKAKGDAAEAYEAERAALEALGRILDEKRPRVERFARVACPANGTTLASGRLDLYFSILLNGARLVLPGHPVVGFLGASLSALIRKRADPASLPGLEAMMPESPLIAVLNRRDVVVDADLTAVAGDMEGSGPLGALKEIVTDLFYRENHDLVVHTRAMVGGARRKEGQARFAFQKGGGIDHFRYFALAETAGKVALALGRPDGSDAGFEPLEAGTAEELRKREAVARGLVDSGLGRGIDARSAELRQRPRNLPVVVLLPGIMGSHLRAGEERVWIHLINLALGRFDRLGMGEEVEPDGLVDRTYLRLARHLEATHRVVEFSYDWRRPVADSADRLATEVERLLGDTKQPVRFLAHSMGGLVARTMVARHGELWRRVTERDGARLVMLGTPNRGSWAVPRILMGHDRLARVLALVDLRRSQEELLGTVAGFHGLLEMLPSDEDDDFFSAEIWSRLAVEPDRAHAIPEPDDLSRARRLRSELLAKAIDPAHMIYVAGWAPGTPAGYRLDGAQLQFVTTARGDGTVPWSLGLLDGVPTWYMEAKHGDMANVPRFFPALVQLLERGTTAELLRSPPERSLRAPEAVPLPPDEVVAFPEQSDLEALVLDATPDTDREVRGLPLTVLIAHGNVTFAKVPVMVGHYDGDTIAGAEGVLDRHLGGALTERRRLDLYPGPMDTAGVFLRGSEGEAGGAVVVGLGSVGSLTPSRLERAVMRGVLTYAAELVERADQAGREGPIETGLASLFIGSGQGGMALEDSLRAITAGVLGARERLLESESHDRVRFRTLRFFELYEDVALRGAVALCELQSETRFRGRLHVVDDVRPLPGRQRRARLAPDSGWWNRLEICENSETGSLEFHNLTQRRARTEAILQPTQRQLIDGFVEDAISSPYADAPTAETLFELLVPNQLKDYAPDQNNLVIIVDAASARYPWELMSDQRSRGSEPLGVRTGLIRNLKVDTFRQHPQAAIGNHALVVGDPPSDLPPLPGAQREARHVGELLSRKGMSVVPLMRPAPRELLTSLFARDYRILHFAAHGLHDHPIHRKPVRSHPLRPGEPPHPSGPDRAGRSDDPCVEPDRASGMVIGPGYTLLTPGEVAQMRTVPELVFVNCCHLGRTDGEAGTDSGAWDIERRERRRRHELAANIGAEFIRMGVRAVIVAGWAVDDAAAVTFASTFYEGLLGGEVFGEAVREARWRTWTEHPGTSTWGAYQCYGDPGYVLETRRVDGYEGRPTGEPRFGTRTELLVALENVIQNAETISQRDLVEERERLTSFHEWVGDKRKAWLDDTGVQAAFARAFKGLDLFGRGIGCYEKALERDLSGLTIKDLEQLANMRIVQAARDWLASDRDEGARREAGRRIKEALDALGEVPPGAWEGSTDPSRFSSERLSILASAEKRRTMIYEPRPAISALRRMTGLYEKADQASGRKDAYPALNALAGRILLHRLTEPAGADARWEEEIERVRGLAAAADAKDPDFWTMAAEAEVLLLERLLAGTLGESVDGVVRKCRQAWDRGGAPRKLRSVLDQLRWMEIVLRLEPSERGRKNAPRNRADAEAVARIRKVLEGWVGADVEVVGGARL